MLNTEPAQGNVIHVNFDRNTGSRCWECGSVWMLRQVKSGALMCGKCHP